MRPRNDRKWKKYASGKDQIAVLQAMGEVEGIREAVDRLVSVLEGNDNIVLRCISGCPQGLGRKCLPCRALSDALTLERRLRDLMEARS